MFRICLESSAKSGMSWNGEAGRPVREFSMKTLCSVGERKDRGEEVSGELECRRCKMEDDGLIAFDSHPKYLERLRL